MATDCLTNRVIAAYGETIRMKRNCLLGRCVEDTKESFPCAEHQCALLSKIDVDAPNYVPETDR